MEFLPFFFLSLILLYNRSSASLLHPISIPTSPAVIRGHLLSYDTRTALQFTAHHTRPLLFLDELKEDGVRLISVSATTTPYVSLILRGHALNISDFLPSHTSRHHRQSVRVVLCVPNSHRWPHFLDKGHSSSRRLFIDTHSYLSVITAVPLPSNSSSATPSFVVTATPTHVRNVITFVSIAPSHARIHPSVPHNSDLRRTFHVYGRHSPSSVEPMDNTHEATTRLTAHQFQDDPFRICVAVALGVGPSTRCAIELSGAVHDETVALPIVSASGRLTGILPSPDTPTSGNLSISLAVQWVMSYDVTKNLLFVTIAYSGNLSVSYTCPAGCVLKNTSGKVDLPDYVKQLSTPGTGFRIPDFSGLRIDSGISVKWVAHLFARAANVQKLNFRQPFTVTVTAGQGMTRNDGADPVVSVDMPSPTLSRDGIILGRTDKVGAPEKTFGRGPWGLLALHSVAWVKYRDSGTVIEKQVGYEHGVRIATAGRDGTVFPPMSHAAINRGGVSDSVCAVPHHRRLRAAPYFENVTGYVRSMDTRLGFNDTDFDMVRMETGAPARVCFGPV